MHTVNMHIEVSEIRDIILKNTKALQMQGKKTMMIMIIMEDDDSDGVNDN